MREILFRGKKVEDREWIVGNLTIWSDKTASIDAEPTGESILWAVLPETVGEYTGLTDKNGKKVFEGDICRFREWSKGDMCWVGKVHYEHQQFVISGNPNKECESPFLVVMSRIISENVEIIGNIHDNPELLKGE